jgi:molecular chaperone HscB
MMSSSTNYFELFDFPVDFDIDGELLAQRYRKLQQVVHPDNYANASEKERRLALQKTAQINEAFQVLKHPMSRGRYLLQLQGVDTQEAQDMTMDGEFLIKQMELRETLASIKQQAQPIEALNHFLTNLQQQIAQLTVQLRQNLRDKNWQAARDNVRQFQFFHKLNEEALRLEEELC